MVNRCESELPPPGRLRNSEAPGMVHGCMVGTGHGGREGTWTLLGPLQSTDALRWAICPSPSNIMGRNNPITERPRG